ncbi:hypothetical protein [Dolichospermum circinale]|uniref:Uncharacterized protein n=1 Tax=Dolichospermum circinale CS-537/01 TaxID=3021739 RepID=A0ABT5A926_9CYAN|nr:hypothetical protein [Dolichospermum circinale]MDB9468672.1 hypothetical protein [Dolichospermum circinale CS-539/09]MDB9469489.1 hypothetical protein [Dolichospermum circinale CS-539]MDB9484103.1 hypothetical protein [Dolichospermum circinale CS-537/05]MDB9488168.1 hypothetical protein [Dolichospermum circinale CS-537/01]
MLIFNHLTFNFVYRSDRFCINFHKPASFLHSIIINQLSKHYTKPNPSKPVFVKYIYINQDDFNNIFFIPTQVTTFLKSCKSSNPGHPDMATPRFAIRQLFILICN